MAYENIENGKMLPPWIEQDYYVQLPQWRTAQYSAQKGSHFKLQSNSAWYYLSVCDTAEALMIQSSCNIFSLDMCLNT